MMTPGKNFVLKKATKAMIFLMKGTNVQRNQFKRMMIEAQLCEEVAVRSSLKSKDNKAPLTE